jgi:hypothetical protein
MRSYGEVVDVRTVRPGTEGGAAAAPEQFLWRGRIYLVREVLAHWIELGSWWVAPGRPRGAGAPAAADAGAAAGAAPRSVAADVGAVEREVWRVEAAPGRSATAGVYDLVRDIPAALPAHPGHEPDDPTAPGMRPGGHRPDVPPRWRLARALD